MENSTKNLIDMAVLLIYNRGINNKKEILMEELKRIKKSFDEFIVAAEDFIETEKENGRVR